MASTTSGDNTMFYFDIETLFNILVVRTGNRARSIKRGDNKEMYNDYAISEQERSAYNMFRPMVASEVFKECFSRYSQDIDDAFLENEAIDEITNLAIAYTFTPSTYFDSNMEKVALKYTEEALVAGMLSEWYQMVGLPELVQEWSRKYESMKAQVKSSLLGRTQAAKINYNTGFN